MNKRIKTFRKPYLSLVVCPFCQKEGIERGAQYWSQHLGSKDKYYHCQKHRKEARELANFNYNKVQQVLSIHDHIEILQRRVISDGEKFYNVMEAVSNLYQSYYQYGKNDKRTIARLNKLMQRWDEYLR